MVTIRKIECPADKVKFKCPYEMEAEGIVIHNTDNDASAAEEISYMHSNSAYVSFHYAIDENEIIQGIPENRNSYNAGDGVNGAGNRRYISIEICRSYSKKKVDGKWVADEETWRQHYKMKFEQAQRNAAEFTALKLKEKGWGIDHVKRHKDFSGKNCPARTMSDYGWYYFLNLVESFLHTQSKPVTSDVLKAGDLVSIKPGAVYYNGKKIPSWVAKQKWYVSSVSDNRAIIDKNEQGTNSINSPVDVSYLTVVKETCAEVINVGCHVKLKSGAKTYTGGTLSSFVYGRTYKVKELSGDRAVITYLGITVAAVNVKDLILV